jgi:hypothetical protein
MGCEKGFVDEGFAEEFFVSYIDNIIVRELPL